MRGRNGNEASNWVNLRFHLGLPVPPRALLAATTVRIPGSRLDGPLLRLDLADSDLEGLSLETREIRYCHFIRCRLRDSDLSGAAIRDTDIEACDLAGADLAGCTFRDCILREIDLAKAAILAGSVFEGCGLDRVCFGWEKLAFRNCAMTGCRLEDLQKAGLFLEACRLEAEDLWGFAPPELRAEGAMFHRCDLSGLSVAGASLAGATFDRCFLADVSLVDADLRESTFRKVEFQGRPGSRSGHTEISSRSHPMYGSQTGFYADDSEMAVGGDPELVRTADLRGADLRGARLGETDLHRVDLRGAKLDSSLRSMARKMGAFVDGG